MADIVETVAAPAAPLVVTPNDQVRESAVDRTTREARERVAAGQPALTPPGAPAKPAAPAAAAPAAPAAPAAKPGEPARNADGTFAPKPGDAAPEAGHGAPAADKEPVEGEEPIEGEEPAEETEEQKTAREALERTVTLVGRNNQEYELELPEGTPKDVIETVRALRNGFMRGEEIRQASADIQRQADEIGRVRQEIELDPAGYLLQMVGDSPVIELTDGTEVNVIDHLVLHMLTTPAVFDRLKDKVEAMLTDERELRTIRAEATAQRHQIRGEMGAVAEERAIISRNLQEVQATVGALVPTAMSEQQQGVLYRDCLRDLKEYADRNRLLTIPTKDIPAILSDRLVAYGVNPVEAATRVAQLAARRGTSAARRPAERPGTTGPRTPAAPAERTDGKRFVASARKKDAVAAIPPGGAGSPTAPAMTAPRRADGTPMGIEETLNWHREQVKKGSRRIGA